MEYENIYNTFSNEEEKKQQQYSHIWLWPVVGGNADEFGILLTKDEGQKMADENRTSGKENGHVI